MQYIVASIGRSGSTLVSKLLAQATDKEVRYSPKLAYTPEKVLKTHSHFKQEPDFKYKAIFLYGHIGDSIASIYEGRVNRALHFKHLEMRKIDRKIFKILEFLFKNPILNFVGIAAPIKVLAFFYLIKGDKFRFKENFSSWKNSQSVMFINYENLCTEKNLMRKKITKFLEIEKFPDFKVKPRKSNAGNLPKILQKAILKNYPKALH